MGDEVSGGVPDGAVGHARPLRLQVEHVVPSLHVLRAEIMVNRVTLQMESLDLSLVAQE